MRFCTALTVTKEVTNDSRDTVLIRKQKLYFLFMLSFTLHSASSFTPRRRKGDIHSIISYFRGVESWDCSDNQTATHLTAGMWVKGMKQGREEEDGVKAS